MLLRLTGSPNILVDQKQLSRYQFNKCCIAMASSGNINRGIHLIIDVIDCKMLKGKYLVGMLSAHPMRLHILANAIINSSVR